MAVRRPHHRDVASDAVEPDDAVHPRSLDGRLALQLQAKLDKERDRSLEVVDHDADIVHPQNRHILESPLLHSMSTDSSCRFSGAQSADDPRDSLREKPDGVHIAYQVLDNSPLDLVLAPGFVSHLEHSWDDPALARFLRQLASFARLIVFDKRGTVATARAIRLW